MTILWMDGFDHYGLSTVGKNNMLAGVYAEMTTASLSTVQSRTGGTSLRINDALYGIGVSGEYFWRRILGASYDEIGWGFAFYPSELTGSLWRYTMVDSSRGAQVYFYFTSTGAITAVSGSTVLGTSPDGSVVASAWQHIEVRLKVDDTEGAIEFRVNGVTVLSVTDVDTKATGNAGCAGVGVYQQGNSSSSGRYHYIDDMYTWVAEGDYNNDFVGDKRVLTLMPSDDTGTANWSVVGAASGYAAINEDIQDGDNSYIETQDTAIVSEFAIEDLVGDYGAIAAVMTTPMQRKTVAGICNTQVSLVSDSAVAVGADRPLTEQYAYWHDVFEEDPKTSSPWTKDSLNAAKLRIERTL